MVTHSLPDLCPILLRPSSLTLHILTLVLCMRFLSYDFHRLKVT